MRIVVVFVVKRIDVLLCAPRRRTAAIVTGSAQLGFYSIKDQYHLFFWESDAPNRRSDFAPKSDDLGYPILKIRFSDCAVSDCMRRPTPFSGRKVEI